MYKTDYYLCEQSYPLDELQKDILSFLYLPLIGNNAYSLYMFLFTEAKRMQKFHVKCGVKRLTSLLNYSIDELELSLKQLEGIGLLNTYLDKENANVYLFVLNSPLSLTKFFNNSLLITLLKRTIGEEDYLMIESYFKVVYENKNNYENMTHSFSDIYKIDLKNVKPLTNKSLYYDIKEDEVEIDYDLTLFYESLKDYAIPYKNIKIHEKLLKQLGFLYQIDNLTLSSIVRESYDKFLDEEKLKDKCKNYYRIDDSSHLKEVYNVQPISSREDYSDSALDKHLHYLETISPYQLLKNKQGGKEPVLHDLAICETLMLQLHLNPGVVNVLLEYVLGHNNNKLSRNYCETIGASWARKNIKTVKEAYNQAINKEEVKQEKEEKREKVVKQNISNDDFLKLLEGLGDNT